jgi:hypothetical protein
MAPIAASAEVRGGRSDSKVVRETNYVGDPWEPPAWRELWIELVKPATDRNVQEMTDPAS